MGSQKRIAIEKHEDISWIILDNNFEVTRKTLVQLFGKINQIKKLFEPVYLFVFKQVELEGIDTGHSWVKVIKIRHIHKI